MSNLFSPDWTEQDWREGKIAFMASFYAGGDWLRYDPHEDIYYDSQDAILAEWDNLPPQSQWKWVFIARCIRADIMCGVDLRFEDGADTAADTDTRPAGAQDGAETSQ